MRTPAVLAVVALGAPLLAVAWAGYGDPALALFLATAVFCQ